MLLFGILCILLAVASAQNCYTGVDKICNDPPIDTTFVDKCNAKHGQIDKHRVGLQKYANHNLMTSFQYLLLSSHFGNYDAHREGFKALYRKLSDHCWEDTIGVLKYLAQRGSNASFTEQPRQDVMSNTVFNVDEIWSLSKALDMQKGLIEEASLIHSKATRVGTHTDVQHDAGITHYIEEHFIEPQTERIRDLAGYINDLKRIIDGTQDASIGVFLFDEYLKKSL